MHQGQGHSSRVCISTRATAAESTRATAAERVSAPGSQQQSVALHRLKCFSSSGGERGTCRSEEVISGGPDDAQAPLDTPEIGPRRSGPMRNSVTSFPAAFQTRSWKGAPFQLDQNERRGVAEANEGHSAFRHDQEDRTVPRSPTNSPSHVPTRCLASLSIILSIFCPPVLKLSQDLAITKAYGFSASHLWLQMP